MRNSSFYTSDSTECYDNELGDDYRGFKSESSDGIMCQKWTLQIPNPHPFIPKSYGKAGIGDHNFCRNPDLDPGGPWCFHDRGTKIWSYCELKRCMFQECYNDDSGADYRGYVSVSSEGIQCQKWTSKFPHKHKYIPDNYPFEGLGDHNYCRNPDYDHLGPWCFHDNTTAERDWNYCRVPKCQLSEGMCMSEIQ
ncbi:plasminogen-like [Amphiura filiformis]|uniref:plasminogen-like n=1 Tax=Amphiura filiformis TaxID=82378 RepID=UPI003B20C302